jgi:hypothetical protein
MVSLLIHVTLFDRIINYEYFHIQIILDITSARIYGNITANLLQLNRDYMVKSYV